MGYVIHLSGLRAMDIQTRSVLLRSFARTEGSAAAAPKAECCQACRLLITMRQALQSASHIGSPITRDGRRHSCRQGMKSHRQGDIIRQIQQLQEGGRKWRRMQRSTLRSKLRRSGSPPRALASLQYGIALCRTKASSACSACSACLSRLIYLSNVKRGF